MRGVVEKHIPEGYTQENIFTGVKEESGTECRLLHSMSPNELIITEIADGFLIFLKSKVYLLDFDGEIRLVPDKEHSKIIRNVLGVKKKRKLKLVKIKEKSS